MWFRVKLGVANSAEVGVTGGRDNAYMSLGNGDGRHLFSEGEQAAVRFDNVRLFDMGDLLNPQNHLEIVGSWTWAMESDNISVRGLVDQSAAILKTALNNTLAPMQLPNDVDELVADIVASIPNPFTFFAGAALASIPGLTDDVVGSNIYAGVGAAGTLATVLDAATESVRIPFIEIPIVGIPPDIGLNPDGGGHIFSLSKPRTFAVEDFSQWNSGHHRYGIQMVPTGTPLDLVEIYNAYYGRCLDLSWGNADGGLADPWPCNGNGRQAWILNSLGQIQTPVRTGRCLDAGSGANGATVQSTGCNTSVGQRWRISGKQIVNDAQGMCLGIPGQPVSGTHVRLRPCSTTDPERQWALKPLAPSNYQRIRNSALDRCAGVAGADMDNGSALNTWMCTDAPDQGWYLDPHGFVINRGSDRCLDGNGGQAGAQVLIWDCSDVPWQRWERTGSQLVNTYRNTCLAVLDNGDSNGTTVRAAGCESYAATGQGWRIDPAGLVISRIGAGSHCKCLDATTGAAGATVLLWDCHGQANQRWHVSGQQLVNDVAGLCLQAPDTAGGALRLGVCNGSTAQRWVPRLQ